MLCSLAFPRWREAKISGAQSAKNLAPVEIRKLAAPSQAERNELIRRCSRTNIALYASIDRIGDSEAGKRALRDFAAAFGLLSAESHRSAGLSDVVALQVSRDAAMSIPENKSDGSLRPVSVGPVFSADAACGRLHMRYTACTRSTAWRDDPCTQEAAGFLRQCLARGEPLVQQINLGPGQGILNNNVPHNRSGFADGARQDSARLVYRIRFHNRVGGV